MNKVRHIYVCLTVVILVGIAFFAINPISATAAPTISFDSNTGALTINGTGELTSSAVKTACNSDKTKIRSVEFAPDSNITSIGSSVFSGASSLTSIEIPASVTSIGSSAFYGASSLTSIEIPASVTSIGSSAFRNCSDLTEITIPENVTSIELQTFLGCSSLRSITIPENVTSIGSQAFSGCSSLTPITIPEKVTSIGNSAFYNCLSLESINIPASVTSIGESAFSSCKALSTLTFSEQSQLTSIGKLAFSQCTSLESINIPDGATTIGERILMGCTSLRSATIPEGVTVLDGTFSGCNALESIKIPESVTTIKGNTFLSCKALTSITIPKNVTTIENDAFDNCISLNEIHIPWKNTFASFDSGAFRRCPDAAKLIYPEGTDSTQYPTDITHIVYKDNGDSTITIIEIKAKGGEERSVSITDTMIGCAVDYVDPDYRKYVIPHDNTGTQHTEKSGENSSCVICVEEHEHDFSGDWKHNDNEHWHECTSGDGTTDTPEAHKWDTGTLTKEATETTKGEKTYTCTVCKATKTEDIPATGGGNTDNDNTDVTEPDVTEPTVTEPTVTEPTVTETTPAVTNGYDRYPSGGGVPAPSSSDIETTTVKVENKITGETKWVRAVKDGENVTVDVGKENNGCYANIYTKKGDFITAVLIENGKAKFTISKDVKFSIVIDSESYGDDVSVDAGIYQDMDVVENTVPVIGIVIPAVVSLIVIIKRKKRVK